MRNKMLVSTFVVVISTTGLASGVSADGSTHNCAGAVSSDLAQSLGPVFGTAVSAAAQAQVVDNFGLRNCGGAPGQNP